MVDQRTLDAYNDEIFALKEQESSLSEELSSLRSQIRTLEEELAEMLRPFEALDIVVDELGVHYRVTNVNKAYRSNNYTVYGIRLNKDGAEAYKNPRPINSVKLEKVEL